MPKNFLGATKFIGGMNAPVSQIELEHGVNAGISLRAYNKNMVSIYEEHGARLERGISLDDWMAMDTLEKALIVAHRRIRVAIHNLQEEAQIKAMKKV